MPAYSSHYIFAEELIPYIKQNIDFELCEEAVLYGTQGPDIFFFHRVFPWMVGKSLRKLGSELHRTKPSLILDVFRDYCENVSAKKNIASSYVYGFIMHYALDRRCHPFVYSMQNKIINQKPFTNPHTAHNIIELSMDTYLLSKRLGISKPCEFNTAHTVSSNVEAIEEVGRLYSYAIPKITGKTLSEKEAQTAINDMRSVQSATYDKTGIKRAVVGVIESIIAPVTKNYKFTAMMRPKDLEKAKKYGNINNEIWFSPADKSSHSESFEELFDKAEEEAKLMISQFRSGISTKEITKNISFLTGVEVE